MFPVSRMNLKTVLARIKALKSAPQDPDRDALWRLLHDRLEVLNARAQRERTARFKRLDLVETWFDTGGGKMGGPQILYGQVIAAGLKCARVEWESGLTNRVPQDSHLVQPARNLEVARECIAKAAKARG